jgi:hypothetical protein
VDVLGRCRVVAAAGLVSFDYQRAIAPFFPKAQCLSSSMRQWEHPMSKIKRKPELPKGITDNPTTLGRFKVELAEIVAKAYGSSDWKKFAIRFGLDREISDHPRFLRSCDWGDHDYEGHVIDLVDHLSRKNVPALMVLFEIPRVQKELSDDLLAAWHGQQDPLVSALSHSLGEVDAARDMIDLGSYAARVEGMLPHDPKAAIGATKDLLEAAMRSILDKRGVTGVEKLDFPALMNRCLTELGMAPNGAPVSEAEKKIRSIVYGAREIIIAANELRNLAGTGHGRVVGTEEELSADDASMIASSGMVLSAWLLRRAESI